MFAIRTFRAGALAAALLVGGALAASAGINTNRAGVAVDGYDVVAYHTAATPTKGSTSYTHAWKGATYHFANAANRDLFAANPARYAPQYGGYCAYAVAQGAKADIDPEAWKVVDGKLYLNLNKRIQKRWEKDIPGYIAKADANWPSLAGE